MQNLFPREDRSADFEDVIKRMRAIDKRDGSASAATYVSGVLQAMNSDALVLLRARIVQILDGTAMLRVAVEIIDALLALRALPPGGNGTSEKHGAGEQLHNAFE